MNRLDMVREALQTLGDVPADAVTAFVAARFGVSIDPKFMPVFKATLLDRARLLARRSPVPLPVPPEPSTTLLLPERGPERLAAIESFAHRLMAEHGLTDWSFAYNRRKRAMGLCVYGRRTIEMSVHFVERNGLDEIRDTILHEIAHALVGPGHGHDDIWKRKCIEVGAKPQRCGEAEMPQGNWRARCGSCGRDFHRYRKPKRLRGWFCRFCGEDRGTLVWKEE